MTLTLTTPLAGESSVAVITCDGCRRPTPLLHLHRDADDTLTCWECVRNHFQRVNERFTAAETRRLHLAGVDEAEIDAYAVRRADYVADVLKQPNVFWLARAQWNPLGFDWRRGVCPQCQRPAELPDPERPCSACRVDELLRVRAERGEVWI